MRVLNKKIWQHTIKMPRQMNQDLDSFDKKYDWLMENLSSDSWYIVNGDTYYFKKEEEFLFFLLRWS